MASFCSNCGFPLGASVAFCSKCGTRQASSPVQVPSAAPAQQVAGPAATAAKSGSGLKILLIVLVCVGFFVVAGVAGVWYVAHRVKQAVVEKAESYGVDLNSIAKSASTAASSAAGSPGSSSAAAGSHNTCDLLSKSEASDLLGEPIERIKVDGEACDYYGAPGRAAVLGQQYASQVVPKAGQKDPDISETMSKMLGAASGVSSGDGEAPMLIMVLNLTDGKVQLQAMNAAKGIFGGIPGGQMGVEVPGLGDRAMRFANLGLNVFKGDAILRLVPGPVPGRDDKAVAIARVVLTRF